MTTLANLHTARLSREILGIIAFGILVAAIFFTEITGTTKGWLLKLAAIVGLATLFATSSQVPLVSPLRLPPPTCNHCAHPCCLEDCPVSAYTKREGGIVVQSQDACIGCGNCVRSCPFGAPRLNPVTHKAEKCNLCFERVDAGKLY